MHLPQLDVMVSGAPSGGSSSLSVFRVTAEQLRAMRRQGEVRVLTDVESAKLAGCIAWPLLELVTLAGDLAGAPLDARSVSVFTASDGLTCDPVSLADLSQGFIVHSGPAGEPLSSGGPLRVCFPPGVAVQTSKCGMTGPVNVKGVVRLSIGVPEDLSIAIQAAIPVASAPMLAADAPPPAAAEPKSELAGGGSECC